MNAAVNVTNYNERFITKAVKEISSKFNFNIIQQRVLNDILYKCTQNVEITALEKEEGDLLTYIDIYANSMRLEGLAPGTIRNKCYSLKELNRYLEKDINKISVADLKMYILHKQSNCKQSTLNTIITTIKAFFSFLCDEGYIEVNPSRKLKKVKEEKRLKKSLNDVTLEQVRLACNNKRDRALIEFAYSSGLRVSELVKFYIKQYLDERIDDNPALFVSVKKPYKRIGKRAIEKRFTKIKDLLNMKELYPHLLRHTFATKLAETADITVVQKLLGHSSINTTMVYAEINDDKVNYQYKASKL